MHVGSFEAAFVICVDVLDEKIITLEAKTPETRNWTEFVDAFTEVKHEMEIGSNRAGAIPLFKPSGKRK